MQVDSAVVNEVKMLVGNLNKYSNKISLYKKVVERLDSLRVMEIAAYYQIQLANISKKEKDLREAANRAEKTFGIFRNEQGTSQSDFRNYLLNHAVLMYEQLIEIDSNDFEAKAGLANVIINGQVGMPMQGIKLLREVTRVDSLNVTANMALGKFSIQSGQYNKAVKYFNIVLKRENENIDALMLLGNALAVTGEKKEAVNILTKCKNLIVVKNPKTAKKIDEFILEIETSLNN
jgi:tetratricopeptide (TPR) repeat protein